jgi:hypothetical protein
MSGDVGEISLRDGCLLARHFTALKTGGDTGIPAGAFAANGIAKADLATDLVQYQDTTLTALQVKALFTTPIVVVTAPGAGKMIIVQEMFVTMVYGAATYSCNASGASLFYKSTAAGQAVGITLTQAFIQASSGSNYAHVRGGVTLITDVTANLDNQAVAIKAATSDPTTGDSPIKIRVYYRVVPCPLA